MHRFYFIGLEKWYKPMIWLDKNQNHLLLCQNDVVMSFVERVNQGEKSLASWLNWLTEPPAVCWSGIMGDLSASWKGVYWTLPETFIEICAKNSMEKIHHCILYAMVWYRTGEKPLHWSIDNLVCWWRICISRPQHVDCILILLFFFWSIYNRFHLVNIFMTNWSQSFLVKPLKVPSYFFG